MLVSKGHPNCPEKQNEKFLLFLYFYDSELLKIGLALKKERKKLIKKGYSLHLTHSTTRDVNMCDGT